METDRGQPHAIMISVPYQGHINPFVSLAFKLASRGIIVTFVHLEAVHRRLCAFHRADPEEFDFFKDARESGLDIRYTTIGDGRDPVGYDRDVNFEEYWEMIMCEFEPRVDELVGRIIGSNPGLGHFLVTDTVYLWQAGVAQKYNLVNVSFWTQPALVFCLAYHRDLMKENGHYPYLDDTEVEIDYIPGVKSISTNDLMSSLKEPIERRIINRTSLVAFHGVKKANFILHNTVQELESETLSALNELHHPSYAIGPINFSKNLPTNAMMTNLRPEYDCAPWLGSKPPGLVLYVSFGSFVHTNKELLQELAYGLLISQVNFIWVIREGILGSGDANIVPDRYNEKLGDRGLIVLWCNQIRTLLDPAVGGFLTHNGWNSTVESIWCGVPMLCYPMLYDQPTNRKLVVDDWMAGINLCDSRSIDRIEVAEKIKKYMSGETARKLRNEANRVKKILHQAVEIGGSSERNFDRFVDDLKAKNCN